MKWTVYWHAYKANLKNPLDPNSVEPIILANLRDSQRPTMNVYRLMIVNHIIGLGHA